MFQVNILTASFWTKDERETMPSVRALVHLQAVMSQARRAAVAASGRVADGTRLAIHFMMMSPALRWAGLKNVRVSCPGKSVTWGTRRRWKEVVSEQAPDCRTQTTERERRRCHTWPSSWTCAFASSPISLSENPENDIERSLPSAHAAVHSTCDAKHSCMPGATHHARSA